MADVESFRSSLVILNMWFPAVLYAFIGSLPFYIMAWHSQDLVSDRFRATYGSQSNADNDVFDFIIVGAGSAGSVLANRLSKDYRVLLLEAGGEPNPFSVVPGLSLLMASRPQYDWLHKTVVQKKSCRALEGQRAGWSGGKCLGGTSQLNFLIYLRGFVPADLNEIKNLKNFFKNSSHSKDFDYWANKTGDPSWNYENLLEHFKSIENYNGLWDNDKYHGKGGDMNIELPDFISMGEEFVTAATELGFTRADLNGKFQDSYDLVHYPIRNGRREGGFRAFIEPIRDRPNLTIYKFSEVDQILMKGDENFAYGVSYMRHGLRRFAYSTKEVIISAGAIMSPKVLMLSGIGPKDHLDSLGIPLRKDLPVGKNLMDHISVYLGPFFVDKPITMLLDRDLTGKSFVEYTQNGKGRLTSSGTQASGFFASQKAKELGEGDWPDLQHILLGTAVYEKMDIDMANAFHVDLDIMKKYFKHAKGKDSFQIITSLGRPLSRGYIQLKDKNPNSPLIIDPKYFEVDSDLDVLVEGIQKAVELVENTTTFKRLGGRFTDVPFPGCENVKFRSIEYWKCLATQYSITLHHIAGTVQMGRKNSKESCVDSELNVIGTKRLRVIDASIMPLVTVSNTNAASTMIGEKGAYLIKKAWANSIDDENNIIR